MSNLLKFMTCGSVDDGKSTLIGRMLYDAKLLFTDQKQTLLLDSKVNGSDGNIDYSLLLDGLLAEREQGITIDVAYRYFATEKRSFVVADTPGHDEYTRNMAVGASYAELAVILIDASKGIQLQTKRHVRICALMGIEHLVFAVNKMDLVDYSFEIFTEITKEIKYLVEEVQCVNWVCIPLSAKAGDNVTKKSSNMLWYQEETLLEYLENVDIRYKNNKSDFILPVQRVCRFPDGTRGFQGSVEAGELHVGEEIRVLPSGEIAEVIKTYVANKEAPCLAKGQCVTVQLNREVDVSRGCVLVKNAPVIIGSTFIGSVLWMDDVPLMEGKSFILKLGTKTVFATITKISHKIDISTGNNELTSIINKNELAECEFALSEKIIYDVFTNHKEMGNFILIDRVSNMTAACGTVSRLINNSESVNSQINKVTRELRTNRLGQKPVTLWFTGLSGAGKSTLASAIEKQLFVEGKYIILLDGDAIRTGLNSDLGYTAQDRKENIRRVAEVARLMNEAGLVVITALISPYIEDREMAKHIIGADNFVEIYVSTPLEECEKRDVKGLYNMARKRIISNFTGISSVYEEPLNADVKIDTSKHTLDESVHILLNNIRKYL